MDPSKSIRTTRDGKRAAAIRDKRHAKATAETATVVRTPYEDAPAAARFLQYVAAGEYRDVWSCRDRGLLGTATYYQESAATTTEMMRRVLWGSCPMFSPGLYDDERDGIDRSAMGDK